MSSRPLPPRASRPNRQAPAMPEPVGASPYPSTAGGRVLRPSDLPLPAEPVLSTEVVFFHLYDVGRSIDLRKAAELIPALDDFDIVKRRDTPASLSLPRALTLSLGDNEVAERGEFESFSAHAKIYAEGAIVLLVRVRLRVAFGDLAAVRGSIIVSGDRHLSLDSWAEEAFRKSYSAIRPAVEEALPDEACERESYTAWCLLECPVDPATFVTDHREAATAFLIGEERGDELHPSQILETLGHPISYRRDDLAIYDLDRCLIVDPRGDYEDILLIIEHANWQLLELRVLDKLLDRWLDEAEDEVQVRGAARRKGRLLRRRRGKSAPWKRARLQSLRFDALFILENLENSSKIIGDYYLGQVYDQLCEVFNTDGWKGAVERRLDILENVYDMVKTDGNENTLITLEIWFIIVCVVIPLVQIWIMLKPTL